MLQRTLQAGVFDEYGLPAFERFVDQTNIKIETESYGQTNLHLTFPNIVVTDKVHAHVIGCDGTVKQHELRLSKKSEVTSIMVVGDDLAVSYRDDKYQGHFHWVSDPSKTFDCSSYFYHGASSVATLLKDGSVFFGQRAIRPGDKEMPTALPYWHDGERFWRVSHEYDAAAGEHRFKVHEVDPQTGKQVRQSVPPWFEETDGGTLECNASELLPAPHGLEDSPLGMKDGMLGWETVKRRDDSYFGEGIDGLGRVREKAVVRAVSDNRNPLLKREIAGPAPNVE